ncbi:MAG: T9SS type A sorting domain-containing protein [Bacteroidia bacterium]
MKKALLIGAALVVGVSGIAQNNRNTNHRLAKYNASLGAKHLVESNNPSASTKRTTKINSNPAAICAPPATNFTSGPNIFGVGGGVTTYKQTCLSYNADLNTYLFTHRRSTQWAAANPMGSGAIQGTWINVGTGAKDSTILYYEATATNPARYPSGTLYNPAGNTTDLTKVYVVGSGPSLPGNGTAWGSWHSTRQLLSTGGNHTNPPADQYWNDPAGPTKGWGGSTMFINYDMQQVGTRCLVSGENNDTTTSPNANHQAVNGGVIGICDFSTGSPVWSYDSIIPPYYFKRDGAGNGNATDGEGGRIAFGPSGQVGYWVGLGRLAATLGNSADSAFHPIVYKSTDGGHTWALQSAATQYDWRAEHPELMKNVGQLDPAYRPAGYVAHRFTPDYKNGIDVTVDANNVLHYVCSMKDQAVEDVDSLAFSYTYNYDYVNHHPIFWDLMTDGTCWKTMLIDSAIAGYVGGDPASDTTASANPIGNAGTFLPYGARLQVSRSVDGTQIVYSWADSDPAVTTSPFNIQPDIHMKAYNVVTGKVTPSSNITDGISVCFFHMMADVCAPKSGGIVAPFVYSLPRNTVSAGVYDGTGPADHLYSDCAMFMPGDYTLNAVLNTSAVSTCDVSVKSLNNPFASAVSNYPNPFSNSTNIVVNLKESKSFNVNVVDALGNVVFNKSVNGSVGANTVVFDAANVGAGVYFYTVTAGAEKITKKMIISK